MPEAGFLHVYGEVNSVGLSSTVAGFSARRPGCRTRAEVSHPPPASIRAGTWLAMNPTHSRPRPHGEPLRLAVSGFLRQRTADKKQPMTGSRSTNPFVMHRMTRTGNPSEDNCCAWLFL